MIEKILFKGVEALKIENDEVSVIVIPAWGGKIASFYNKSKEFELLFQHNGDYKQPKLFSDFSEFDASGFDDAFPNIKEEIIDVNGKGIRFPDHGEIWSLSFHYKTEGEVIKLWAEGTVLPYLYEKEISINGNQLEIKYNIENIGDFSFPCIWTMHCLINCQNNMELKLPTETSMVEVAEDSTFLGNIGTIHTFPQTKDVHGNIYQLDRIFDESVNKYEKYYIKDELSNGKCGVYYPNADIGFAIEYDAKKLPYLGFWVTEGGFRNDYNCALEPSNGYYDKISIAKKNNAIFELGSGNSLKFDLLLSFKNLE